MLFQKQADLGLHCLSRPFWQVASVRNFRTFTIDTDLEGAQWISGRVLVLRPRGRGIEPHQYHNVVSLSKAHLSLLSTGSTQEDPSRYD